MLAHKMEYKLNKHFVQIALDAPLLLYNIYLQN